MLPGWQQGGSISCPGIGTGMLGGDLPHHWGCDATKGLPSKPPQHWHGRVHHGLPPTLTVLREEANVTPQETATSFNSPPETQGSTITGF